MWSEAAFVTVGGLVAGAADGRVVSHMLVKVLTGVFDPPPAALSVPWPYLVGVAALSVGAVMVGASAGAAAARRPAGAVLRVL